MFRKTMVELGYVEDRDVRYDYRDAAADTTRFPALAVEVVDLRPDLVVCQNPQAAKALMNVTKTIPIVIVSTQASVIETGLVSDLAHPGGNLTGLTGNDAGVASKRLQLLKETAPKIRRAAVLQDPGDLGTDVVAMRQVGAAIGVEVVPIYVKSLSDLDRALAEADDAKVDSLIMGSTTGFLLGSTDGSERVAAYALERRWPASVNAQAGGLMLYGGIIREPFVRAARNYVHRIFLGARPGDLPFEGPSESALVINMCTAAKLGLSVPPTIMATATEAIQCAR